MIGKILGNRIFWIGAMFVFVGIMLMGDSIKDKNAMAKGVTDFNEMTELDFIEGRFVEGTVTDLLDEFAYEEEYNRTLGIKHGERVSAHYYIMPLRATMEDEYPQFVAVRIGNTELAAKAQQMVDEYWNYMETDEEPEVWTEFQLTGKISKLDGELLDYFYEWFYFDENTTREDIEPMVCPYIITYNVPDASSTGMIIAVVITVIGAAFCVIAVLLVKKQMRDEAQASFSGGFSSGDSFPTRQPAPGSNGGYNSVGAYGAPETTDNAGRGSGPSANTPRANGSFEEMDSIDSSGLGIGIGDDDK